MPVAPVSFPPVRHLPGLEATQGPNAPLIGYRTPFFGADREYADDEGWITVHYRSRNKRKQRRWRDLGNSSA
jgi:hypothetical protein